MLLMIPMASGLLRSGKLYTTIIIEPVNRPPTPAPAMARPTIRVLLLVAVAQIREPSSKMAMAARNVYLILKIEYILPKLGCNAAFVSK